MYFHTYENYFYVPAVVKKKNKPKFYTDKSIRNDLMAHLFTRSAFIVKSLPHSWLIISFAAHKGNEISAGFPSIPV